MENKGISGPVTNAAKPPKTFFQKIRTFILCTLVLSPFLYSVLTFVLQTPINRAFHYEKQCTITAVVNRSGGSKSYSSSNHIYIQSPDCSDIEFVGKTQGLTNQEVVDRIRSFKGKEVTVDVGIWQEPFSTLDIVGIHGLDLSK